MAETNPVIVVAELQDGAGQDHRAARRAKACTAQGLGNLRIRIAFTPQLLRACDHRVIPRDVTLVEDGRDDDPLREMATYPADFDISALGGCPLDNPPCDQAPQQGLALGVTQLLARPQLRKTLAQVEQLLAERCGQGGLTGLMGKAFRGLFSLAEGPEFVLPGAFEFGRRQPVVRIDVLIAAPG